MFAQLAIILVPCALLYAGLWRYHRVVPASWSTHLVAVLSVTAIAAALRAAIATVFPARQELQHPAVWGGVIPLVVAFAAVIVVMGAAGSLDRTPLPEGPQMQVSGVSRGRANQAQGRQEIAAAILVVGSIIVLGAVVVGLIAAWLVR